jgi:aryl-alcohol dehydrogenase-like predicted oxidoreductase
LILILIIACLSLAWLLNDNWIIGIIIEIRKPEHLESVYKALNMHLNETDRIDLANLFPILQTDEQAIPVAYLLYK